MNDGCSTIHLERPDEPVSRQFVELLGAHGLACRVSLPTHDRGWIECWMWWHPEMIYRLRWSTSSISVFPITVCFAGQHRSFVSLRCTRQYLAVPGAGLAWRRFGLACGRHRCAPPTPGLDSISTVWLGSTTPRSPLSSTAWCRLRLSHADGGRPIRGSTMSVRRRTEKSADWSVP